MGGLNVTAIKHDMLLLLFGRAGRVDRQDLGLIRTGMRLAEVTWGRGPGDTMVGEQTGVVRKDRECNTEIGEGRSLLCPVLLAHQGLCSWFLMFIRSTLVPLLFKWRLSCLYRPPLVQKESKLLIKP